MTYLIGDIHGCLYTLQNLLKRLKGHDLVFVGDYLDRGKHSRQVLDLMIELELQGAVCLRGNHDDVIDWLLNGGCYSHLEDFVVGALTTSRVASWWLSNGLSDTLKSYEVGYDEMLEEFRDAVPHEHKQFIRNLSLYWENETHFACHAFMRPDEELPRTLKFMSMDRANETLWSRFEGVRDYGSDGVLQIGGIDPSVQPVWDKIGVFGHTPTFFYGHTEPIYHGKIRMIDTGAFKGMGLTAYCCETDKCIVQETDDRDVDFVPLEALQKRS